MMLRKRTRSYQMGSVSEPQSPADELNHAHGNAPFLRVPDLFVGFNPNNNSEADSVISPTSTLDFRIFSSLGNPFRCPTIRSSSQTEAHHKNWDCNKVGLRIVDSLDDGTKITLFSDNKNILFGGQMRARCSISAIPDSKAVAVLPGKDDPADAHKSNSDVVFEIGEVEMEAKCEDQRVGGSDIPEGKPRLHSGTSYICSIPASEIQLSEDYTCVRTHGPNPKVTHIFGDYIFECHGDKAMNNFLDNCKDIATSKTEAHSPATSYLPEDFLKFCHSCNKKMDGEDIYMYRGEKAFCSYNCRSEAMEFEEHSDESEIGKPNK